MERRLRVLRAVVPVRSLTALTGGALVLLSFSVVYSYGREQIETEQNSILCK